MDKFPAAFDRRCIRAGRSAQHGHTVSFDRLGAGTRPAYIIGEQDAAGKPREGVEHGTVRNRHEVVDALREAGLEERTT